MGKAPYDTQFGGATPVIYSTHPMLPPILWFLNSVSQASAIGQEGIT